MAPDPDHLRVAVIGTLETYINGSRVQPDRTQSWLLQFESKGGRMLIKEWKETPLDDPMMVKAVVAVDAMDAVDAAGEECFKLVSNIENNGGARSFLNATLPLQ